MAKDAKAQSDTKKSTKSAASEEDRDLVEIRQDLEVQRKTLLSDAGAIIGQGLNYSAENLPDLGDQASVVADQNFMLRLKEREQRLLKKIDEALDRLANGTFGVCESCGGEISIKRLKARPVTTLCIECKTKQEEDERVRQ